jgi:hypothetical protein
MVNPESIAFVVCVRNDEVPASLERRKIYQVLPDADAEKSGMLRVIDESDEDYLYPSKWFIPVNLDREQRLALQMAS